MPTPYESALMSSLAYNFESRSAYQRVSKSRDTLINIFRIPSFYLDSPVYYLQNKKWEYYTSTNDLFTSPDSSYTKAHQCVVFINHTSQEIVMAHRGTVLDDKKGALDNIKDDIEILKGEHGEQPNILADAIVFLIYIVGKKNKEYPSYTIHQTGHSLGGFAAECCAAYLAQPFSIIPNEAILKKQEKRFMYLNSPQPQDANAITFDSLGSMNVLKKVGINASTAKIRNYLPSPNIANTANPHAGMRYLLETPNNQSLSAQNHECHATWDATTPLLIDQAFWDTLSSHALHDFIKAFNPDDGEPYSATMVLQWPSARNTFIKSSEPGHTPLPETTDNPNRSNFYNIFTDIFAYGVSIQAQQKTGGVIHFTHIRQGKLEVDNSVPLSRPSPRTTPVLTG